MKTSFKELNDKINPRLAADTTYLEKEFSFIKIFQHGLTYAYNESSNKILKHYFDFPIWIQKILFKRSGPKTPKQFQLKATVIMDPGRKSKENGNSHFFEKIASALHGNFTTINLQPKDGLACDYNLLEIVDTSISFDEKVSSMLHAVNRVYKKLKISNSYSAKEKLYITSALHIFFISFLKNYSIFHQSKVERCFFIMHYHNEGLIAAGKSLGIKMIELQHGLVHTNDIYYCYDKPLSHAIEKGFFPDEMLVFGAYWKDVLSKGAESQYITYRIVGGVFNSQKMRPILKPKENIILVASQKTLYQSYVEYISALLPPMQQHPEWKIILKLHPLEKEIELYHSLKHPQLVIAPLHSDINEYLEVSKIQISLYSTTFYDAAGFDVMNFAWQGNGVGFDYSKQMVEEGIAEPLFKGEDPILKHTELLGQGYSYAKREYYYAPFVFQAVN